MPRAKWWDGSAWVDLSISGAADLAGDRFEFGPPSGGTVDEFLAYPSPLSQSNWDDPGANVGCRFALSVPGSWIGVRYWRPSNAQADGVEYVFGADQGGNTLLTPNTPVVGTTRGAFVIQEFAAPVAVTPGVDYIACYHTNRYGFSRYSDGAANPFSSASGRLFTDSSVNAIAFFTYSDNTVPLSSAPNFHFNISPVVRFPA